MMLHVTREIVSVRLGWSLVNVRIGSHAIIVTLQSSSRVVVRGTLLVCPQGLLTVGTVSVTVGRRALLQTQPNTSLRSVLIVRCYREHLSLVRINVGSVSRVEHCATFC